MKAVAKKTYWVILGICMAGSAGATNGYSPTGFGTASKGMAGAGAALPLEGMVVATNPAGGVHIEESIDVGVALFSPGPRGFTADSYTDPDPFTPPQSIPPGRYESDNDVFLVPHFAWTQPLDEVSTLTIALGANGGMNTDYEQAIWSNFGAASAPTGVDFSQLFLGFSYSRKLNEDHSVGVMPVVAVQRFKAEGLQPFTGMSIDPANVTNRGYDYAWGAGLRVGWLGEINERLSLAASVQSPIYMTKFDNYRGLFAEQGDFDVPPTAVLGVAFKLNPAVTLVADIQRIWYSDVESLANPNEQTITGPDKFLGADEGLGFGWQDIDIFKLGVQWEYSPELTLRAGVSHATELFAQGNALFNVLAPATPRTHASVGLTYDMGRHALALAYTRAFDNKIGGVNPPFTGAQTGFVQMSQHELEASWSYRF